MSARRPHYTHVHCAYVGCAEQGHYSFNSQREKRESSAGKKPWFCVRHTNPESVLSANNPEIITILFASKSKRYPDLTGLFWSDGSGFTHGDGYKAYADDFPPGTKLIVTARIELPEIPKP